MQVQLHEPILTAANADSFKADFELVYSAFAKVGVPIHLVTYYDDIGESYPWVIKLPVQVGGCPLLVLRNGNCIGLEEGISFLARLSVRPRSGRP